MSKPIHVFQLSLDSDGGAVMDPQLQKMEVWPSRYTKINMKEFIRHPETLPSMGVVFINNNQKGGDSNEHA